MNILLATSNPHKLDEILAVIDVPAMQWHTLDWLTREYGDAFTEPVEDRDTFEDNALLKAQDYAQQSGWVTVADDSGLEVDALGGAPGVLSARYSDTAGPRSAVDPANNAKLLRELRNIPAQQRTARFVCAMAMAWPPTHPAPGSENNHEAPPHAPIVVRGTVEGRILLPEEADDAAQPQLGRGTNGFGYDPLFVLPSDHGDFPGMTAAQLTPEQKNAISHRGNAARKLLDALQNAAII